jgi:ABC-type methionine transport system ATPase subunit
VPTALSTRWTAADSCASLDFADRGDIRNRLQPWRRHLAILVALVERQRRTGADNRRIDQELRVQLSAQLHQKPLPDRLALVRERQREQRDDEGMRQRDAGEHHRFALGVAPWSGFERSSGAYAEQGSDQLNAPAFQVEHLSLAYPRRRGNIAAAILNDVSFTLERGHALTLIGPSGSGKSTLLRCLNRLVEPSSGTLTFDGRDVRTIDPRELRRQVALVMQTPVLFEGTIGDNLRLRPAGTPGDFSEPRLHFALEEVGLEPERLEQDASTLSGGEKQRVAIARALLGDPQVLLLDEPTSALDPPNALLVATTISRLRTARGLTIVAVTHQPDLVRRLGGALLYLVKGRVQAFESADDPAGRALTDARLQAFLAGEPMAAAEPRP